MTATIVSAAHLDAVSKLGTRLPDTFDAETALREGGLADWNVRKVPMYAELPVAGRLVVPKRAAVVRTNPETRKAEFLGDVGKDYHIVQNEEHVEFLNALVEESGARFELAGSLRGGSRVFISMKLPGHISVGGVDPVDLSLLALNSHDGSMSFTLMALPIRFACANVINLRYGSSEPMFRIRHTSGVSAALAVQARQALDLTFNYLDDFQKDAERLIEKTMTQSQFEAIIEREFGADEGSAAAATRADKKIAEMNRLFADADTQAGIRGTAWAGLNAMTEWFDHYAPTRGETPDASRAVKAIFSTTFKNRALDLMMGVSS